MVAPLEYPDSILRQAQSGDVAGAIAAVDARAEAGTLDIPGMDLLGLLYANAGQLDQSLKVLRIAAEAARHVPVVRFHCAQIAEKMEQHWEAAAHYRKAWEMSGGNF